MKRTPLAGLLLLGSLAAGSGCGEARRDASQLKRPITDTLYELDLRDALPEQGASFLGQSEPGLGEALGRLKELSEEPLAKGLFVRLGDHQGHLGDVEDLAAAFDAFRAQKRPVHCHYEELDNAGYALASHCDRLSAGPAGMLNLVGLGAQVMHGRKLLDWLGVRAELMQMGKYKGAADPFTREDMGPELKASMDQLLDDLDAAFRNHLKIRNARTPEGWQAILDAGPYTAKGALAQNLVDAVAADDEARAKAKAAASARVIRPVFDERSEKNLTVRELFQALAGGEQDTRPKQPYLAIAHLTGEIIESKEGALDRTASEPFIQALRRWGDDRQVRAVVLRIESPGGSALASDRMWHMVHRVAGRKPVIVSLGDVAASGGYYVASAGTYIVAAPGSVVGSIGVVGGKMVVQGLADRAGLKVDTLRRAKNAVWLSPFEPFTDSERARFEEMLADTYQRFLERISLGRKRPVASLLPAAEGRVMGGQRAKDLGLVDEVGGLGRAIQLARERGKLTPRSPIETWPNDRDALRALTSLISTQHPQPALSATVAQVVRAARPLVSSPLLTVLGEMREPVVLALPVDLRVE
ncbi:MAG: S49 family peptidase [Myxococcales bacterium]